MAGEAKAVQPSAVKPRPVKRRRSAAAAPPANAPPADAPPADAPPADERVRVQRHLLSCVPWAASGVTALATSACKRYVAAARADGSVELRDAKHVGALPLAVVRGGGMVSGMAFGEGVLVVGRMEGSVDFMRVGGGREKVCGLEKMCGLSLAGGGVWGVAVKGRVVVVACDDKCVRVIRAEEGCGETFPAEESMYVVRAVGRGRARVLSVVWAGKNVVVAGDAKGAVRWIDVESGKEMGAGRLRGEVRVWALAVAQGGREVLAGDSTGRVSVWDAHTKVLQDEITIEALGGDVLALQLLPGGSAGKPETVVVGSASGSVAALAGDGRSWTPVRARGLHSHDVRALCCTRGELFVCGSLDSSMSVLSTKGLLGDGKVERVRQFSCPAAQPNIQFIARQNVIVSRMADRVEVWRADPDHKPVMLLCIRLESLAPDVLVCAVSSLLRLVVVGSPDALRVFQVRHVKCSSLAFSAEVHPVNCIRARASTDPRGGVDGIGARVFAAFKGTRDIAITGKEQVLVGVNASGKNLIFCSGLASPSLRSSSEAERDAAHLSLCSVPLASVGMDAASVAVRIVAAPTKENQLACWDTAGRMVIIGFALTDGKLTPADVKRKATVAIDGPVTAASFSPDGKLLCYVTRTCGVFVYDVVSGRSVRVRTSSNLWSSTSHVAFSPSGGSLLCAGPGHAMSVGPKDGKGWFEAREAPVEPDADAMTPQSGRKRKLKARDDGDLVTEVHLFGGFENILGASVFGPGELVLVNGRWDQVVQGLPRAVGRKVFGT